MATETKKQDAFGNTGGAPKNGGRLQLLVNNVCDVVGMRRNMKEMSFLADFFRSVNSSLIMEDVLETSARKIYEYFQFNLMVVKLVAGSEDRLMAFSPLDIGKSPEGLDVILRSHAGLRPHDVKGYRCLGLDQPQGSLVFGNTNFLELPMKIGNVTIYSEFNFVSHFSADMLEGLMESFASALRNSIEYEKVRDLSMRDSLTGLFNRRVLEEMLDLEERKRHVTPLSLLVIDLDNFKLINDTYGHPAGDLVLQTVARILRENTRGSDFVVRSGGEEFSVMLPGAPCAAAQEVAERIRSSLESSTVTYNGRQIRMTASLGVAHRSKKETCSVAELVHNADQAMYEAKRLGKNRVCVMTADMPAGQAKEDTASRKVKEEARIFRIK
jgi:two-component system, cell cycle response regulator